MIAGRLTAKHGFWYVILELKHDSRKRYSKWISTGLKTSGTKKKAEEILFQKRLEYTKISQIQERSKGVLFDAYMEVWLNDRKTQISLSTYLSYYYIVKGIVAYFRMQKVLLHELKPYHITEFYRSLYSQGLSGNTVLHYHTAIRHALETAVINDLIIVNPADKIERPKKDEYIVRPYSDEENQRLIEAIVGEKLELTVLIALYTGLRRSEVLGLRWKSIDFKNDMIFINHSVKYAMEDGKRIVRAHSTTQICAQTRKRGRNMVK